MASHGSFTRTTSAVYRPHSKARKPVDALGRPSFHDTPPPGEGWEAVRDRSGNVIRWERTPPCFKG